MKNPNNPIRNRTHHLLARSTAHQPTALLRIPCDLLAKQKSLRRTAAFILKFRYTSTELHGRHNLMGGGNRELLFQYKQVC